ncbi:MAG: hypothetical protein GXO69_10565 [Acidobacteria bacterium]|nr:hypothetical protein [Acidobacteriota bacterium]
MGEEVIAKGLEVWTLQTLVNISILLGFFALGLAIAQGYFSSLRERLTLRVSIELWDVILILITDMFLVVVVLLGFLVLNPDIMADIKIAVPFVPLGTILFAIALVIRLFYGGHHPSNPRFRLALLFMFSAVFVQTIGFSLIMEAPGKEYLALHPSPFWNFIKMNFRSNATPHGLELAQLTFSVLFPILIMVFIWGFIRALKQLNTTPFARK